MATQNQPCPYCGGAGVIKGPQGQASTCPLCDGTGNKYDPGMAYWVEGTFVLTALQAVQNQPITLPNNQPFRTVFLSQVSTGIFTVLLKDGASGYQLMNQQVHRDNIFGTAQNPAVVVTPYVFTRQIMVDLTDLSNAGNTIRLCFIGVALKG